LAEEPGEGDDGVIEWLRAAVLWIYDFLAEDIVLVIGTVLALLVALGVARANARAAGFLLFATVILVIVVSIWRTVSSTAS
jgi:hypothetical protein